MKEYFIKLFILIFGCILAIPLLGFVAVAVALMLMVVVAIMICVIIASPVLAYYAERDGINVKIGGLNMYSYQKNKDEA